MSTEIVAMRMGAGPMAAVALEETCIKYGIANTLEKCHFLAQIAVESAHFQRTRENLNYSVAGLLNTFGTHRITRAQAAMYGRSDEHSADQEAIANIVYGGAWGAQNLGNTQPGDGWRYRGRGYKQITGRHNYTEYGMADDPDALAELPHAALSAGWYWQWRQIGYHARKDDLLAVTREVNGGLNGLDARRDALAKAKAEFAALISPRG